MASPRQQDYRPMAQALFDSLCNQFSLFYEKNDKAPVEICLTVPKQKGLSFDLILMLQNIDELWLTTTNFTMSFFPCGKEEIVQEFKANATDLLSGRGRIVEYRLPGFGLYKANLQTFDGKKWHVTYGYGKALFFPYIFARLFPGLVKTHIVINNEHANAV